MKIKADEVDFLSPTVTQNGTTLTGTRYPWESSWVTSHAYVINDCVEHDGSGYVCMSNHTSGVFATDLLAGDWALVTSRGLQGLQGIQGDPGATGSPGATGAPGADGTQYPFLGSWASSYAYAVNDCIEHDGSGYVCMIAHTSGTFATDLGAGKWKLLVQGADFVYATAITPSDTPTELTPRLSTEDNHGYVTRVLVIGHRDDNTAIYYGDGLCGFKRGSGVGTITVDTDYFSFKGWGGSPPVTLNPSVDTGTGEIIFTVTGENSIPTHWTVKVELIKAG